MRLENLLEKQKATILKKWFDLVVHTYPDDTSKFLKSQKDPFANPVGGTFKRGLAAILDELLKGWSFEPVTSFLDPMIRIRALQDFTPAKAVSFIFSLKAVIRDILKKDLNDSRLLSELHQFESQIDEIGLLAFNIYVECKEKIYELKANEVRNKTFAAFERAGLVRELPDAS